MKRLLTILAVALVATFAASAQESKDKQCCKSDKCCQNVQCFDVQCCDECFKKAFYPGWYLGIQGGVVYTTSNEWAYAAWDKLKHLNVPNVSLNVGYDFTPVFGLRGSLSGPFGNYPSENHWDINRYCYGQLVVDATFDICSIFRENAKRLLNPYLFVGGGAFYRFAVNGKDAFFGPVVRLGGGLDIRLSELVDLTLELQDNGMHNKFNTLTELDRGPHVGTEEQNKYWSSEYHGDDGLYYGGEILKIKKPFRWDDNVAALIGLKFNLGAVKKRNAARHACAEALAAAEAARLAAEEAARREAERLAAEQAEAERLAAEQAEAERLAAEKAAAEARAAARAFEENIYFDLDKSFIRKSEQPKIDKLISILNEYPEAVITISGYADEETGNPKHNMGLSQRRADRVAKALQDAGIAADRITTAFFGDTVRVSPVQEKNRVSVCVTK